MAEVATLAFSSVLIWIWTDFLLARLLSTQFAHAVQKNSIVRVNMETNESVARCSARLFAQRLSLQREQRDQ